MSVLRARYLVALTQWSVPPAALDALALADFAQLTDAVDAEVRQQQQGR